MTGTCMTTTTPTAADRYTAAAAVGCWGLVGVMLAVDRGLLASLFPLIMLASLVFATWRYRHSEGAAVLSMLAALYALLQWTTLRGDAAEDGAAMRAIGYTFLNVIWTLVLLLPVAIVIAVVLILVRRRSTH